MMRLSQLLRDPLKIRSTYRLFHVQAPEKLRDLDLDAFAEELHRQGFGNKVRPSKFLSYLLRPFGSLATRLTLTRGKGMGAIPACGEMVWRLSTAVG